ncbi:MAG: hypothetical protein ACYDAR_05235, partial [Thermomicrobiales bacterium]
IISYYMNHPDQWAGIISNADARHKMGAEGYGALFDHYLIHPQRYAGSIYTRKLQRYDPDGRYQELLAEYQRTAAYAEHVAHEYDETHARRMELEHIFRSPRSLIRTLTSEGLGALSRRVKP